MRLIIYKLGLRPITISLSRLYLLNLDFCLCVAGRGPFFHKPLQIVEYTYTYLFWLSGNYVGNVISITIKDTLMKDGVMTMIINITGI